MKRRLHILLCLGAIATFCHAETRWCSIVGRGSSDTLLYPPIARVARVTGVVLSRIIYTPTGQVLNVEEISGPAMLSSWTADQLKGWTVKTDASGEAFCETIVISDFRLYDKYDPVPVRPTQPALPSIFRISVDGEIVVNSCGEGPITTTTRFRYFLRRALSWARPHNG
jgi:hypothetical protein